MCNDQLVVISDEDCGRRRPRRWTIFTMNSFAWTHPETK